MKMSIDGLHIDNFKGISASCWIDIKPITVFIGANSSGKSSCIHSLACLAQTAKTPNNPTPLLLDGDFVDVHLGRFIEVVHSRSYQDTIGLGISMPNVQYFTPSRKTRKTSKANIEYHFKCTKRTQDVEIVKASFELDDLKYILKRGTKNHQLTETNSGEKTTLIRSFGIALELDNGPLLTKEGVMLYLPFRQIQDQVFNALRRVKYLGPFRQAPLRRYPTRGAQPIEVGPSGESAVTMLANEVVQTRKRPHLDQIAKWLAKINLGKSLSVSRVGSSDLFDIEITLPDGQKYPIADLGYGMSQVLPVLVQCAFANLGDTILIEQPELHLHPLSARRLGSVIADTAINNKATMVIETHSPELVKQLIQESKKRKLNQDEIAIYKVTRESGETQVNPINIDFDHDYDVVENWELDISKSINGQVC